MRILPLFFLIFFSCDLRSKTDLSNLPAYTYFSLTSNDSVTLKKFNNEKLILYFIDTQCDFCELEIKELIENRQLLNDIQVVLVGSNGDSNFRTLDSTNLKLWVMDSSSFLNVMKPTSFVLNNGILKAKNEGWIPLKKMISQVESD